jgi:hypothetical protein
MQWLREPVFPRVTGIKQREDPTQRPSEAILHFFLLWGDERCSLGVSPVPSKNSERKKKKILFYRKDEKTTRITMENTAAAVTTGDTTDRAKDEPNECLLGLELAGTCSNLIAFYSSWGWRPRSP